MYHVNLFIFQYYMGWISLDTEESEPVSSTSLDMCHPLCQCEKCVKVQKVSLDKL